MGLDEHHAEDSKMEESQEASRHSGRVKTDFKQYNAAADELSSFI